MKKNVKSKASLIKKHRNGTGGGPPIDIKMSNTEQEIIELIGPVAQDGHNEIRETSLTFADENVR